MRALIVWLLLCLIWGSTWLFIKLGLEDLPPFTFAGIRFVIAAIILLLIVAVRRMPMPRELSDWRLMAITGLLSFTLNYGLLFWGEQYVSSGLAALLQAIIPAFGLVVAHRHLLGERITVAKICGVALAAVEPPPVTESFIHGYSTVTDFARLRGWSTSQPRLTAMW